MGAYLPRLAVKLIGCGYGNKQACRILLTAAAYGEWLTQHCIALENAGRAEAQEYAPLWVARCPAAFVKTAEG